MWNLFRALLMAAVLVTAAAPAGAARCDEDMPCWTWSKMGDRKRGVVTVNGTFKVVDCAHLRDLLMQDAIDPRRTPWLRGDHTCGRRR